MALVPFAHNAQLSRLPGRSVQGMKRAAGNSRSLPPKAHGQGAETKSALDQRS